MLTETEVHIKQTSGLENPADAVLSVFRWTWVVV